MNEFLYYLQIIIIFYFSIAATLTIITIIWASKIKTVDFSGGLLQASFFLAGLFISFTWPVTVPMLVYRKFFKIGNSK